LLPYKTNARYLNYRIVKNIVATTILFSLSVAFLIANHCLIRLFFLSAYHRYRYSKLLSA